MSKLYQILIFVFIGCAMPSSLFSQANDFGAIGSLAVSANFGRSWSGKVEQELRFNQNLSSFDRLLTSIGLNYSIIRKILKAEIDYDFIYQRQNEYFEFRHRASVALVGSVSYHSFDFELRTRGQAIYRDETRGDYKFNPKFVWRNKLECTRTIFGSPIKPYLSAEIFCPLNTAMGFCMDGFRVVLGAKYRLSEHVTILPFLRYDQDVQQPNPKSLLYGGFGWSYKL
jgi:hypothetical protein